MLCYCTVFYLVAIGLVGHRCKPQPSFIIITYYRPNRPSVHPSTAARWRKVYRQFLSVAVPESLWSPNSALTEPIGMTTVITSPLNVQITLQYCLRVS